MEKLMGKYITKKQQVLNLLNDIEATITSRNADIAIPILKWTQEKIRLDTVEKTDTKNINQLNIENIVQEL